MSEIKSNILWLYIRNGEPHSLGLNLISNYDDILSPIIESKFTTYSTKTWNISNKTKDEVQESIMDYYNNLIVEKEYYPGQYGDWIKCSEFK